MPDWVEQGYNEYARRLVHEYKLERVEIPLGQRSSGDSLRATEKEGERMLASIAAMGNPYVVALQVGGKPLSTEQLAQFLQQRARDGRPLAFCIGGPDGIAPAVDAKAELRWSLSSLTLPHALVRVIVAEALYRAVSVIKQHPYHRA
jgi:23S rRNA (pseudouridine1915-N3)-methyltransferase